ncbi:MAG: C26 family cysteine hydrolase domain-containing family, partial [Bacteroidales bacterium]|nr:C26 family cysteine hydrolase domain-containing family [Bacteroidales bacterium]
NVIDLMDEQKSVANMVGTMRLGNFDCEVDKNSIAYRAYQNEHIQERHRHRFEFNNNYKERFETAGMKCVGINPDTQLVEIVELSDKKWYLGTQFHPEYNSTVLNPNPLFVDFIKACIDK